MAQAVSKVTGGPAKVFYAIHSAGAMVPPPDLDDVPNGIVTDAMWATATWEKLPFTVDGLVQTLEEEIYKHNVNELLGPIGGHVSAVMGSMTLVLAERDSAEALKLALNTAASATIAAGADQVGKTEQHADLTSNALRYLSIAVQTEQANGFSRVTLFPKVAPGGKTNTNFKKGELRGVAVTFDVFEDPGVSDAKNRFWQDHQITAVATS